MTERKYLKLLREDLSSGRFGSGAGVQLPTMADLARRYRCSVSSIRQAMEVLKQEKLLYAVAGKGTFTGSAPVAPPESRARLIGTIGGAAELPAPLRCDLFRRGWLVADCPEEQGAAQFLELAEQNGFAGILCHAPLSEDCLGLLPRLRRRGVKVAHLWPGAEELSRGAVFSLDCHAAGLFGVAAALKGGSQNLALVAGGAPPYWPRIREAVENAARNMRLAISRSIELPGWPPPISAPDRDEACRQSCLAMRSLLARLPRRTALLCSGADVAFQLRRLRAEADELAKSEMQILSLFNGTEHAESESGIYFDFTSRLEAACAYLTDLTLDADQAVRRSFQPAVREVPFSR